VPTAAPVVLVSTVKVLRSVFVAKENPVAGCPLLNELTVRNEK
jgi:hypothetical protein